MTGGLGGAGAALAVLDGRAARARLGALAVRRAAPRLREGRALARPARTR